MQNNTYISAKDLLYQGILNMIKKSQIQLQPVFEALTNSLESLEETEKREKKEIKIYVYYTKSLSLYEEYYSFEKLIIKDNGIGFTDTNFDRFRKFKDNSKGFKNKGSGRIQLLHFFNKSIYNSFYQNGLNYKERKFIVSKSSEFLKNNAIIFHEYTRDSTDRKQETTLELIDLLDEMDQKFYNDLSLSALKKEIIDHYILYFCFKKENLPSIILKRYEDDKEAEILDINDNDIPDTDKSTEFDIKYSKYDIEKGEFNNVDKSETFKINAFKLHSELLKENQLKLTNKDEIIEKPLVNLDSLSSSDKIDNKRYLFLISSNYLDTIGDETRGELNIRSKKEIKNEYEKNLSLFNNEVILLDDIDEIANDNINNLYPEINDKKEEQKHELEKLQKMFLLDPKKMSKTRIKLNENDSDILKKFYNYDVDILAKNDADIKKQFDRLEGLNPSAANYVNELESIVDDLSIVIPKQNKNELSQYVARRKLLLELYNKILDSNLQIQIPNERNIDEKLLHNLLFQQSSDNPESSSLWIINEEFIYFKGTSDNQIRNITIDDIPIIREDLNDEEKKYINDLNESKLSKSPDVLLFPDESKCIIIEFKNPNTNVSKHLNQINQYATIIRNLSKDEFCFLSFYGYLIGEKISSNDIRGYDPEFVESYHFDYLFRPSRKVAGLINNRQDGNIYTEVIKYSTLLERAKKRNEIFIKLLGLQV